MPNGADAATTDGTGQPVAERHARLSFGVLVLALFQLALGIYWLAALFGIQVGPQDGMPGQLVAGGENGRLAVVLFGGVRVLAAFGLLLRLRAAWALVMLLTGLGLASSIAGYAIGKPDDLRLLFEVVSAFYLNQPGVRLAFGVGAPPKEEPE